MNTTGDSSNQRSTTQNSSISCVNLDKTTCIHCSGVSSGKRGDEPGDAAVEYPTSDSEGNDNDETRDKDHRGDDDDDDEEEEEEEQTMTFNPEKAIPLEESFSAEIPQTVQWLHTTLSKYCGMGTVAGSLVVFLTALGALLWNTDSVRQSDFVQYYVHLYHTDLAFYALAVVIPAVSYFVLLFTAVPLSLLVMFDSSLVNKYYLSNKRENVNGTFWFSFWMVTLNHMFLVFLIVISYPYIWGPILTSDVVGWSRDMSIVGEITANPWMALVFAAQFVVSIYLEDFYYYVFHAALHKYKFLYRHIHIYHHKFYPVMAIHGANVHPIEYVLVSLPILFASITTLTHFRIAFILVAWRQIVNADTHSGFHHPFMDNIYRFIPFMNGADSHDYHHYMVVGNYSTFSDGGIDRYFGTEAKGYSKFKLENQRKREKMKRLDK